MFEFEVFAYEEEQLTVVSAQGFTDIKFAAISDHIYQLSVDPVRIIECLSDGERKPVAFSLELIRIEIG